MKEKLRMLVFVLVLGAVWTTALVAVDRFTQPIIDKHKARVLRMNVLRALGVPHDENNAGKAFEENVQVVTKDGKDFYRSTDGAIAFMISGAGAQAPVSGVLALEADLETVRGIAVTEQKETPGLGDRVFEEEQLAKFRGKKVAPSLRITAQGKASGEGEVDGITGATISCRAFEKIINEEVARYVVFLREDGRP